MESILINQSTHEPGPHKEYLSAAEASALLGIRRQTLYAYVSRGLVRSMSENSSKRTRLYQREDLERLRIRAEVKGGHEAAAATAMNLGAPIVPTRITEITGEGPRYRGHLATDLVRQGATFEQTTELLWTGLLHDLPLHWPHGSNLRLPAALQRLVLPGVAQQQILEVMALVTLQLAMGRGPVLARLLAGRTLEAAREVVLTLVGCFGWLGPRGRYVPTPARSSVAHGLLHALGLPPLAENVRLLDALLVLMADHELSPGTLAARVAASAGASLHSCLAAALSASAGSEVARLYDRADDFLVGAGRASTLLARAQDLLASGRPVPGFDHPVYPAGDPRARCILDLLRQRTGLGPEVRKILTFVDGLETTRGLHARHEVGVIAACKAMGLPTQAASALFVLARIAGWVAHIQEQRLSKTLLRPRAKFVHGAGQVAVL